MKAIVRDMYGSADVLELDYIARPVAGDDEALIRVHAAGVGPDVWHLMTGAALFLPGHAGSPFRPLTLQPVFYLEPRYLLKMTLVAGHHRQSPGQGD